MPTSTTTAREVAGNTNKHPLWMFLVVVHPADACLSHVSCPRAFKTLSNEFLLCWRFSSFQLEFVANGGRPLFKFLHDCYEELVLLNKFNPFLHGFVFPLFLPRPGKFWEFSFWNCFWFSLLEAPLNERCYSARGIHISATSTIRVLVSSVATSFFPSHATTSNANRVKLRIRDDVSGVWINKNRGCILYFQLFCLSFSRAAKIVRLPVVPRLFVYVLSRGFLCVIMESWKYFIETFN